MAETATAVAPRPPIQIPLNITAGAVIGLGYAALTNAAIGRWMFLGAVAGLSATIYNAWAYARYTEQAVGSGGVVVGR